MDKVFLNDSQNGIVMELLCHGQHNLFILLSQLCLAVRQQIEWQWI